MASSSPLPASTLQNLITLIDDYHDFNPSRTERFSRTPTALEFSRQVSKGLPCVYAARDLLQSHKAWHWSQQDLVRAVSQKVEVAATPDGRADSLCTVSGYGEEKVFLEPANIAMSLEDLFARLGAPVQSGDPVLYLQSQNGNLTSTDLAPLFNDLPKNFAFAEDVLGEPEAVNIWIGDECSTTSAHRDPYENLYVVLRGTKIFTLWPPVDEVALDGLYVYDAKSSTFCTQIHQNEPHVDGDPPRIPWVTIDPSLPREQLNHEHPLYKHARPRTVIVQAGQMLYLPSGWYHHVGQECGMWDDGSKAPCISVNYWYDQDYEGEKYVMRQLVSRLTQQVQQSLRP